MTINATRDGASHAVAQLLRKVPEALAVEVLRVAIPPSVEHRPGATPALSEHAAKARAANTEGDSFTETFLAIAEAGGDYVDALQVVGFHQPLSAAVESSEVLVEDLDSRQFDQWLERASPDEMIVMTSRVRTSRGVFHLPLLDLKLRRHPANDPVALAVAARLGGGTVMNSGSSYHVYGHQLKTDEAFYDWLLQAQLLSRVVDTRWVTHQLLEKRAALRLSRGGGKHAWPTLIAAVGADGSSVEQ